MMLFGRKGKDVVVPAVRPGTFTNRASRAIGGWSKGEHKRKGGGGQGTIGSAKHTETVVSVESSSSDATCTPKKSSAMEAPDSKVFHIHVVAGNPEDGLGVMETEAPADKEPSGRAVQPVGEEEPAKEVKPRFAVAKGAWSRVKGVVRGLKKGVGSVTGAFNKVKEGVGKAAAAATACVHACCSDDDEEEAYGPAPAPERLVALEDRQETYEGSVLDGVDCSGIPIILEEDARRIPHRQCLGVGASACVLAATIDSKHVAVKVPHAVKHEEVVRAARLAMATEAAFMLGCQHANLLPISGLVVSGLEAGSVVSGYVTPQMTCSLDEWVAGFRTSQILCERSMAKIFLPVALALAHLHADGKIHADVKPANILLDQTPGAPSVKVYMADFGCSCEGKVVDGSVKFPWSCIRGTPMFVAPEIVADPKNAAGPAIDGYALGVSMWECLAYWDWAAGAPFTLVDLGHPTQPAAMGKAIVAALPPAQERAQKMMEMLRRRRFRRLSPAFSDLLLTCLEGDPTKRMKMADVAARLATIGGCPQTA